MLERLEAGEADVMLADLSYSKDREERIDFTAPFMNIGVGMAHVIRVQISDYLGLFCFWLRQELKESLCLSVCLSVRLAQSANKVSKSSYL